jgi:excisionase family DNA binding protein
VRAAVKYRSTQTSHSLACIRGIGTVRARRGLRKQKIEEGSPRGGEPSMRSPAAADRARADLATALASLAALFRAASDSLADGAAEVAAPNHSPVLRPEATTVSDPRLAFSVNDAARVLSVSNSTINKLIKLKSLRTVKLLGRRLIPRASIEELLAGTDQ